MDTKIVLDFLSKLGEQVNVAGQQVFKIYVQQAYATGITDLVVALIGFIVMMGSIIFTYKFYKKVDKNISDSETREFSVIMICISGVVGLIGLVVFSINITDGIKELINPQYYALQDLFNAVKNTVK